MTAICGKSMSTCTLVIKSWSTKVKGNCETRNSPSTMQFVDKIQHSAPSMVQLGVGEATHTFTSQNIFGQTDC